MEKILTQEEIDALFRAAQGKAAGGYMTAFVQGLKADRQQLFLQSILRSLVLVSAAVLVITVYLRKRLRPALLLGISPTWLPVLTAEIFHGFASCMLTPAIAAISFALVGRMNLGDRLGRNARFASLGNGIAAAAMS